jgi:tellurite resistance protein
MNNFSTRWFAAAMGLAGLGLACRGAGPVVKQPPAFSEIWVALGALGLVLLLAMFLYRLIADGKGLSAEFSDPARLGYCATLPLSLTLVAAGVQTYAPRLADALWTAGALLLVVLQIWALARWLRGGIELAQVNGGWMMMLLGGVVVPSGGMALGHPDLTRYLFGVAALFAAPVMTLVLYRTVAGPAMPEAARPTWFIFLVPPSLIYAHGATLWGPVFGPLLDAVFFGALALAGALLLASWRFLAWPFSSAWWAFTFPLDALAFAAAHYARAHPGGPWPEIAAVALWLAVAFVAIVLLKTGIAAFRGWPAPARAAPPPPTAARPPSGSGGP